jgi:hypothetical protein
MYNNNKRIHFQCFVSRRRPLLLLRKLRNYIDEYEGEALIVPCDSGKQKY